MIQYNEAHQMVSILVLFNSYRRNLQASVALQVCINKEMCQTGRRKTDKKELSEEKSRRKKFKQSLGTV